MNRSRYCTALALFAFLSSCGLKTEPLCDHLSGILVENDSIILASSDGNLLVYDTGEDELVAQFDLGREVQKGIQLLGRDLIYCSKNTGEDSPSHAPPFEGIVSWNFDTGKENWSYPIGIQEPDPYNLEQEIVVEIGHQQLLYLGDSSLSCISRKDGHLNWIREFENWKPMYAPMAIDSGFLCIWKDSLFLGSTENPHLTPKYAFRELNHPHFKEIPQSETHYYLDEFRIDRSQPKPCLIAQGRMLVHHSDEAIVVIDLGKGTRAWKRPLGGLLSKSLVDEPKSAMFTVGNEGIVSRIDLATGRAIWRAPQPEFQFTRSSDKLQCHENRLFVPSYRAHDVFDASTGKYQGWIDWPDNEDMEGLVSAFCPVAGRYFHVTFRGEIIEAFIED